jgi:hypothetical protein
MSKVGNMKASLQLLINMIERDASPVRREILALVMHNAEVLFCHIEDIEKKNAELEVVLKLSNHREHDWNDHGKCLCGQCEFVRWRDIALSGGG